MKHFFVILLGFLLVISTGFAHIIENSKGDEVEFFSSQDPILTVITETNKTITFSYYNQSKEIVNQTQTTQECNDNYCYTFSGLTYTQYNSSFIIESNNLSTTLKRDEVAPELLNFSTQLDEENKTLVFSYDSRSNGSPITLFSLYIENGGDYTFLADLFNSSSYEYDLNHSGELEFLFRLEDQALNTYQKTHVETIPDIFDPILHNYLLIRDSSGSYSLFINASDDIELSRYKISQNSLSLEETLNVSSIQSELNLPFNQGSIDFLLEDTSLNNYTQIIELDSDISTSSFSFAVNREEISFRSNAEKCVITELNGNDINMNMENSGNEFFAEVSLNDGEFNEYDFYCQKNSVREYFEKELLYDTTPPENTNLEVESLDDGSIELNWDESSDLFSDVSYEIYRNEEKIAQTSGTSYKDVDVSYPEEYYYEIVVSDRAGNTITSNSQNIQPLKVDVMLSIEVEEKEVFSNMTQLRIDTEENVDIFLTIESGVDGFYQENLTIQNSPTIIDIPLFMGGNDVMVKAVDSYNNSNTQRLYITQKEEIIDETLDEEQLTSSGINQTNEEKSQVEENENSWFWLFMFAILLILGGIVFYGVYHRDRLRRSYLQRIREYTHYQRKRKDDTMLGKSLEQAKQKRIEKQQKAEEKRRKAEKKKKEKQQFATHYQRKKYEDIAKSKPQQFNLSKKKQKKSKKSFVKPLKQALYEIVVKIETLFSNIRNSSNASNEKSKSSSSKDNLNEYLDKQSRATKWNSSHEYKAKPKPKEESKDTKKETKSSENNNNNNNNTVEKPKKQSHNKASSLDDYLAKRSKKKNRYLTEKEVEKELSRR